MKISSMESHDKARIIFFLAIPIFSMFVGKFVGSPSFFFKIFYGGLIATLIYFSSAKLMRIKSGWRVNPILGLFIILTTVEIFINFLSHTRIDLPAAVLLTVSICMAFDVISCRALQLGVSLIVVALTCLVGLSLSIYLVGYLQSSDPIRAARYLGFDYPRLAGVLKSPGPTGLLAAMLSILALTQKKLSILLIALGLSVLFLSDSRAAQLALALTVGLLIFWQMHVRGTTGNLATKVLVLVTTLAMLILVNLGAEAHSSRLALYGAELREMIGEPSGPTAPVIYTHKHNMLLQSLHTSGIKNSLDYLEMVIKLLKFSIMAYVLYIIIRRHQSQALALFFPPVIYSQFDYALDLSRFNFFTLTFLMSTLLITHGQVSDVHHERG